MKAIHFKPYANSIALSILMLVCFASGHGKLSEAEIEKLKKDASGLFEPENPARDTYEYITRTGTAAIDRAIKEEEYSVIEAAMRNRYMEIYHVAVVRLREVPIEPRKRLLLMALVDDHLWPYADYHGESDSLRTAIYMRQLSMRDMLSTAFGINVENPDPWTSEQRVALAESIQKYLAESAQAGATAAEPPTLKQPPQIPAPAQAQTVPRVPANTAQNPEASNPSTHSPFRWIASIAGILVIGFWILLRALRKRT